MEILTQNARNTERKRLLAVNFGGIGDEILFLPTLATIKKYFPSWHISLLVEPRSASIGQVTNLVDGVITFDIKKRPLMIQDLLELLGLMRNGNFDLVLSSGSSPLVSVLLFLSGIGKRIGYNSNLLSRFLLTNPVPLNKNQYAAGMYHDLVKGLGIEDDFLNPQICLSAESRKQIKSLISQKAITRIVIHPGTSKLAIIKGIFKTWPAKDWAHLIELLLNKKNIEVILAGGPDDKEPVDEIVKALNERGIADSDNLVMAYGKTKSLAELGALIEAADLLVCVDSAPMHMAVGLNKKTVALFAVTDPKKLLPNDKCFVALTNSSHAPLEAPSRASRQDRLPPGVVLPAEHVLQSVLDQLSLSSSQGRSPERCG